jgi:hypothetical protein
MIHFRFHFSTRFPRIRLTLIAIYLSQLECNQGFNIIWSIFWSGVGQYGPKINLCDNFEHFLRIIHQFFFIEMTNSLYKNTNFPPNILSFAKTTENWLYCWIIRHFFWHKSALIVLTNLEFIFFFFFQILFLLLALRSSKPNSIWEKSAEALKRCRLTAVRSEDEWSNKSKYLPRFWLSEEIRKVLLLFRAFLFLFFFRLFRIMNQILFLLRLHGNLTTCRH